MQLPSVMAHSNLGCDLVKLIRKYVPQFGVVVYGCICMAYAQSDKRSIGQLYVKFYNMETTIWNLVKKSACFKKFVVVQALRCRFQLIVISV